LAVLGFKAFSELLQLNHLMARESLEAYGWKPNLDAVAAFPIQPNLATH
jgi:hypothetical protein